MRVMLLALGLMLGAGSLAVGAGFDGDAEHLRQTRKPIPILRGIGTVDFPITCQNPQTQQYFNQGIALLHGSEPREADRSFYQACRIEPSCPMTWWGLAAANLENRPLAAFYVERAFQLREAATDREQMWIRALNSYLDSGTSDVDRRSFLVTSLDRIIAKYPDDLEACAFLVRQFVENREAGLPIPLTSAADLMIEHVLQHNPAHPVRQFKLLLWEGVQPERALQSAEYVQRDLPSAARIQTAAGRVHSRLERHEDALACFEASTLAACRRMERDRLCPVEVEGFFENAGLQIDHLARAGRVNEAGARARQLIEMPDPESPPPVTAAIPDAVSAHGMRTLRPRAPPVKPSVIGQQHLLDLLVDYGRWQELLVLESRHYFQSTDRGIQLRRLHAVGLAHFSRRDAAAIGVQISALQDLQDSLGRPTSGLSGAIQPAQFEAAIRDLRICQSIARNEPPIPAERLPSWRLVGLFPDVLDREAAANVAAEPVARFHSAALGLNRIRLLNAVGQPAAAVTALRELKQRFSRMDADLVPNRDAFAGGAETPLSPATEASSSRTWQPPLAPEFKLSDRDGHVLSLDAFRGKRVVLVFYLGAGCPHCIEQLQSFAPLKEAYDRAGLTVIAVSTDSVGGLQKTFQVAGAGDAIPFLLVSDEKQSAFRDFGAFDTRDNEPLHGTFLINRQGRIVWHNIRREPFMATRSLLDEARRVFSLDEEVSRNAAFGVSVE